MEIKDKLYEDHRCSLTHTRSDMFSSQASNTKASVMLFDITLRSRRCNVQSPATEPLYIQGRQQWQFDWFRHQKHFIRFRNNLKFHPSRDFAAPSATSGGAAAISVWYWRGWVCVGVSEQFGPSHADIKRRLVFLYEMQRSMTKCLHSMSWD